MFSLRFSLKCIAIFKSHPNYSVMSAIDIICLFITVLSSFEGVFLYQINMLQAYVSWLASIGFEFGL